MDEEQFWKIIETAPVTEDDEDEDWDFDDEDEMQRRLPRLYELYKGEDE